LQSGSGRVGFAFDGVASLLSTGLLGVGLNEEPISDVQRLENIRRQTFRAAEALSPNDSRALSDMM